MSVACRLATESDLPTLNQFQRGIIAAEAQYIPRRKDQDYSYYDLSALLSDTDTRIIVAEHQQRLIGSGYVQKRPSKAYLQHDWHGYVGFIYTLPDYRGQGVAKKVISALAQQAKAMGLDELRLDVFADNQAAVATYKASGFTANLIEMRYPL
ncbi:GNAT family N-acetyltransferase [Alteromonas halophila]|uniref:N-acetyltransferase domain-containing protein n=1 Tax=Alteromonas halophila TaxID=516698 RepID=A0A918JMZ4_9ALTE|nr:GNAT family N-acetyltransferase [Alteromonas halophila]GGW91217.1 hypothetical protein GCM10007391_26920 [Alteromonas halophila]